MKTMKNTMKCLVAVFMMAMAFVVTGITAQAVEATYAPPVCTDLSVDPGTTTKTYIVPAKGYTIIPIYVPSKGGMYYAHAHSVSDYGVYGDIYVDAACTVEASDYFYSISDTSVYSGIFTFDRAGTYYLKLYTNNSTPVEYYISSFFVSGENRTLTSGKTTAIFQNDYDSVVYSKFKATKTGYIAVSAAEIDGNYIYVTLMNNKKKALSDKCMVNNGTVYFGVQKGQTYYIATYTYSDNMYNLRVTQSQIKEKSGSSKAKAVTINKNKTVKGVQIANKKASGNDWYKIYLPSSKKVTFTIKGGVSSPYSSATELKIKIIPANSRVYLYGSTMWVENGTGKYSSKGKLPAGTYYLQVSKYDKMASGWYSIKWK